MSRIEHQYIVVYICDGCDWKGTYEHWEQETGEERWCEEDGYEMVCPDDHCLECGRST